MALEYDRLNTAENIHSFYYHSHDTLDHLPKRWQQLINCSSSWWWYNGRVKRSWTFWHQQHWRHYLASWDKWSRVLVISEVVWSGECGKKQSWFTGDIWIHNTAHHQIWQTGADTVSVSQHHHSSHQPQPSLLTSLSSASSLVIRKSQLRLVASVSYQWSCQVATLAFKAFASKEDIHGRYQLLYEYGGTWLDTDVISIKPLPNITNFVSVELTEKNHLAAGAIRFQRQHEVVRRILDHLSREFSGSVWGANGPLMLTRVMVEYCDEDWSDPEEVTWCRDVAVFKQKHFYPVNWRHWFWMFSNRFRDDALSSLNTSFIAHLWGSHSRGWSILWWWIKYWFFI